MLIEFTTEENVCKVLKDCSTHQKDVDVMAIKSPFLWFRAAVDKKDKLPIQKDVTLLTEDSTSSINEDKLIEGLMQCDSVSDQIQMLYDKIVLNDIGIRLRYMVARQVSYNLIHLTLINIQILWNLTISFSFCLV